MTIKRTNAGDVDVKVQLIRDGKVLSNREGADNIYDYINGIEIYESLTSATLEAQLIISDTGGFLGALTGSEQFKITIRGSIIDRTYYFRAYDIDNRVKSSNSESYMVNCASEEFFQNEVNNVFGNSEVIFKSTESSSIVKQLLRKDNRFINTNKSLFIEETTNKQKFIAPNWRPFDTIYWIAQRSVRKARKGGTLQNGFVFYENSLGYHFKSIDNIIDSVNKQTESSTNFTTGDTKLYTYVYSTKKSGTDESDQFKIENIVFPEERDFLSGLRHGSWSGYSIGFDPVTVTQSKMGLSTDMSVDAYRYNIQSIWNKCLI